MFDLKNVLSTAPVMLSISNAGCDARPRAGAEFSDCNGWFGRIRYLVSDKERLPVSSEKSSPNKSSADKNQSRLTDHLVLGRVRGAARQPAAFSAIPQCVPCRSDGLRPI